MSDAPRAGPPENRERRAAGTAAAHLGNKHGNRDSANNATKRMALSSTISTPQQPNSGSDPPRTWDELREWGKRARIPIRGSLWFFSCLNARRWIVRHDAPELLPRSVLTNAMRRATHVIVAPDPDSFTSIAAELAAQGGRVLLVKRPIGARFPGERK